MIILSLRTTSPERVVRIGGEAAGVTTNVVATAFDLSLQTVVAWLAHRLPVLRIVEEIGIALVWDDVIDHVRQHPTQHAQRVLIQEGDARAAPTG